MHNLASNKKHTINAEILAGIKFGGFGYTSSHKNIGGFI